MKETGYFAAARTSLKETSYDKANKTYMTESQISVYDFDKVKESFVAAWQARTGQEMQLKSNDALYADGTGQLYFIEFKNGRLDARGGSRSELRLKMYESFLVLAAEDVATARTIAGYEPTVRYSSRERLECAMREEDWSGVTDAGKVVFLFDGDKQPSTGGDKESRSRFPSRRSWRLSIAFRAGFQVRIFFT